MKPTLVRRSCAIACALALTSCALGPDYQRPQINLPPSFDAAVASDANAVQPSWWTLFGDANLNELVQQALTNNRDVQIAAAQVEEAEAVLRQANASIFPQIDLGASATRSRVSTLAAQPTISAPIRDDRRVAASTSFEIDFWGKLRRASEAARAQALGSAYGRDVVMLTLAGTTTQAYFLLRSLDAQIAALANSVKTRGETFDVVKSRVDAGFASDLDLNQALGARADAAAQLKELQRQREVVEHQLGALTGRLDLKLASASLQTLPVPPIPPAGLPSTLLDRRPDIRVAEQNLISANAQIGVAKAALFPTISLTGSYGGQSSALDTLFNSGARIWSAGFGLALPIFDAGRNAAKLDQSEARQKQSLANYQKTIETAFREVSDAISNVRQSGLAEDDLQARLTAARKTLELATIRYDSGYVGYLDVLDAQRTTNDAELSVVRNRQSRLAYTVDFMKSLGGGWSPTDKRSGTSD
jgi:outer membrane protein, multidrug efflux system